MGFAETLIYAADTLEALAGNRFAQIGAAAVVLVAAASFTLGELGGRVRAAMVKLAIFGAIGTCGMLAMVAVKGVPGNDSAKAPASAPAPAPARTEQRLEAWVARQQKRAEAEQAEAERTRQGPSPEARAFEAARRRLLAQAEARQLLERERAEIRRTPEAERTHDERRRDAAVDVGLAEIDRAEGRIASALRRYRAAQEVFARLGDPLSRRASVETSLHTAAALEERSDMDAARAAYRRAIADQRGLAELPERERRSGLASALVRYALFEIDRHEARPARAALDEAADHYGFLRMQRGKFDVLKARAELAIVTGESAAARAEIAAMRRLVAEAGLADLAPEIDVAEARFALNDGRGDDAAALFARAATALRPPAREPGPAGLEALNKLATALLGLAEAEFATRNVAAARLHAGEAIAFRREIGERPRLVEAFARLAVWEAGAGNVDAAERALAAALAERRALPEINRAGEAEGAIRLLCAGALRPRQVCQVMSEAGAPSARP